jgi:hypothetical protein
MAITTIATTIGIGRCRMGRRAFHLARRTLNGFLIALI